VRQLWKIFLKYGKDDIAIRREIRIKIDFEGIVEIAIDTSRRVFEPQQG
jgi:hypothetical protein